MRGALSLASSSEICNESGDSVICTFLGLSVFSTFGLTVCNFCSCSTLQRAITEGGDFDSVSVCVSLPVASFDSKDAMKGVSCGDSQRSGLDANVTFGDF